MGQSKLFDRDYKDDKINGDLVPNFETTTTKHLTHNIRDTSRESYHELLRHPYEINGRQLEYLQTLKELGHAASDQEVTAFAGHKDPNYFRPRRFELVEQGLIGECSNKRHCTISGRLVHIYWFT